MSLQLLHAKFDTVKTASFEEEDNVVQKALELYRTTFPLRAILNFSFSAPSGYNYYEVVVQYEDLTD